MKTGILLMNLGTPRSPQVQDVRDYLREFLMDPCVVDLPWPLRFFLVNAVILRKRPASSSALYKKIWTERGSPLLFHTQDLTEKIRKPMRGECVVEMAMRYGAPSISSSLEKLRDQKVTGILMVPLYPQYSLAATQSSLDRVVEVTRKMKWEVPLKIFPPFYDHPLFLESFAEISRDPLGRARADFVIFSFHGLPERQIKKTDETRRHCVFDDSCCAGVGNANQNCYRAQCFATAEGIARRLGLTKEKWTVGFQSRLGVTPWIKPWSDEIYRDLARRGVKRLAVLSPSFVADCLETLEEIAIRGREDFIKHGGEELILIPSLNSTDVWVNALGSMIKSFAG